jgi:hypothetical protein
MSDSLIFKGFCSVDKDSMLHILGNRSGGRGVIVVPGGAREGIFHFQIISFNAS